MDLIKIGKFIADRRKLKKLTQVELAEKLNITDRAVSKWENGKSMPDSGIMLKLCEILGINVNELLNGECIEMEDYNKKTEELLLEIAKEEEKKNKDLMMYEIVIGVMSSITFIILLFTSAYAVENKYIQIGLFIFAFIIFIVGVSFALKIETETGYYECKECKNKYVPKYKDVYFAMHLGTTRYLKCPKCNKRTWNKKVLVK